MGDDVSAFTQRHFQVKMSKQFCTNGVLLGIKPRFLKAPS